jgi:hypothetical protein
MTSQVKGMLLLSLLNIYTGFESSFILKNHHTWEYQLLIPHKQNPHTLINQLAVTAKRLSQPGIQLCVASVAVKSKQTDFHGLHERPPWFVQHSCLIRTQLILVIRQRLEKYSSYITVQRTSHPDSKCVFSNRQHCTLSTCSPTM